LASLHEEAASDYVFPGRKGDHRVELKADWATICKSAGIANARMHDLRHTYASLLASAGQSLPVIGALLGHTQSQTTHRYSHLLDDPLRAATERVGAVISPPKGDAEVVKLRG
jgi:integrase